MSVAVVACASLLLAPAGGGGSASPAVSDPGSFEATLTAPASTVPAVSASAASSVPTSTASPSASAQTFALIDMFAPEPPATPGPTRRPGRTARPEPPLVDPGRDIPDQSLGWLIAKAAGRIVLSKGKIGVLDPGVYPLADPITHAPLPAARTLDVSWTRWIVEPPAQGKDAKGNLYHDLTYWNLCGPGAATVALYYWQQLTGHPNVTGMAGYFLDPYAPAGVAWPSPGPVFLTPGGKAQHQGTYWSGTMRAPGYTANGRGFLMYMAMAVLPAGWTSPGIDVFVGGDGRPLYPTRGSPPPDTQAGLNWEASGHARDWAETWYASVNKWDPTMARDLTAAVMLDVGRDGVPVIVSADTFFLPNWQAGSRTPHTRHSVTIVGYDNKANPPTFTYLDTCGRLCNYRAGNRYGQSYTISQAQMVKAVSQGNGMGFIW